MAKLIMTKLPDILGLIDNRPFYLERPEETIELSNFQNLKALIKLIEASDEEILKYKFHGLINEFWFKLPPIKYVVRKNNTLHFYGVPIEIVKNCVSTKIRLISPTNELINEEEYLEPVSYILNERYQTHYALSY